MCVGISIFCLVEEWSCPSAHHGRWTNCLQLPFNCYMKMTNTASSNRQGLYSYKDLLSTVRHMRRMILLLVLKDNNCTVTLEWVFGAVTVYFWIFFTHILIYVSHKVLNLYRPWRQLPPMMMNFPDWSKFRNLGYLVQPTAYMNTDDKCVYILTSSCEFNKW